MTSLKEKLYQTGMIPVIKISDAARAPELALALTEGGLPAAEVTFRTDAAAEAIEKMRLASTDMLIGAGTVLTLQQLRDAKSAGASFAVAPGLNPRTVEAALEMDFPIIPGCMTPSEIETALSYGLDFVKFFPAEAAGGVKMLKAIGAPYASVRFMPTGGITPQNAETYLRLPNVLCCGGSYIADEKDITNGDFEAIRSKAKETAAMIAAIRNSQN